MAPTQPPAPDQQREALLDAQRRANQGRPRNFKEDALTDKTVAVEPDGTGPTSTQTFDADTDQALGSGGEETPAKDQPAEDQPGNNQPGNNQPGKNQPGKNQPATPQR